MVGFVIAHIVGIQYNSGNITGREMVGLIREPLNPHDPHAIAVFNTSELQVGYIERSVAEVLSPLLDQCLITVEGIVPNTPGRSIRCNRYKIPCQIHIFAGPDGYEMVKSLIFGAGLHLIVQDEAAFGLSEAVIVREANGGMDVKRLDDIFNLVDENVSRLGFMEVMEPPKEVIISELFLHQKEGLAWLVRRENSSELPPFWVERNDGIYINELTNYHTDQRPESIRGGIFADDMGLGKTLTLLSLIALDRFGSGSSGINNSDGSGSSSGNLNNGGSEGIDEDDDGSGSLTIVGGKKSKRGRGTKLVNNSRKKQNDGVTLWDIRNNAKFVGSSSSSADNSRKKQNGGGTLWDIRNNGRCIGSSSSSVDPSGLKTTLVVCPPSVFATWITQLGEHTRPGRLRVYLYYAERTKDATELQKYDLVLTTYSTLGIEESWSESPMFKMEWWRVILDEAHLIKNANAQQSRAVTKLYAKRRWAVTGTPIQNGTFDLFSLMVFLRFQPFSVRTYWTTLVQRPLANGSENGFSRLQVLMSSFIPFTSGKEILILYVQCAFHWFTNVILCCLLGCSPLWIFQDLIG